MSCLCVWAHSWAHTSILVSSLCVPGLWKCQIIRLEGRRPPAGGTQKMWGGGGGMVPFVQLTLSTALFHHHSTLKLPAILPPPRLSLLSLTACCLKAIFHILIYFCILPLFMTIIFTPSMLCLLCISSHFSSSTSAVCCYPLPSPPLCLSANPPTCSSSQTEKKTQRKNGRMAAHQRGGDRTASQLRFGRTGVVAAP